MNEVWCFLTTTIDSQDFLTYIAILLAFIAYRLPIKRDYESIQRLIRNLKNEIQDWVQGQYDLNDFNDKKSYIPFPFWNPLPLVGLKELERRQWQGIGGSHLISEEFSSKIPASVKYAQAYNDAIKFEQNLIDSDPALSNELLSLLKVSHSDPKITPEKFKELINSLNSSQKDLAYSLFNARAYRHVFIVGGPGNPDGLNSFYAGCIKELDKQPSKPLILKFSVLQVTIITFLFFTAIEMFFK